MPQAIKGLKQLADLARGQALAGVLHANSQFPGIVGIDRKAHAAAVAVVLDGVGEQVDQCLLQAGSVSVHQAQRWHVLEMKADATALGVNLDHGLALQQYAGHRHTLHQQLHLARFDNGQIENFIDQLQQVPARFQNLIQAALLPRCGGRVAGIHQLRKAQNGRERCAQFVAHAR